MSFISHAQRRHNFDFSNVARPVPARPPQREQTQRASSKKTGNEQRYNFLSCLASAQACKIDFTGIAWVEAQPDLGHGAQALVSETRASVETVLAFKRRSPDGIARKEIPEDDIESAFRELTSEIWVLGQPGVKGHPNIVQLMGICWEIIPMANKPRKSQLDDQIQIWPVLIFEKAHQGVWSPSFDNTAMHEIDIIHGDVKPANALVFGKDIHATTTKLADFGFSTTASTDAIVLPISLPWNAPELEGRKKTSYNLSSAKKVDVYCFGMLCLWVLFWEQLEEKGSPMEGGGIFSRTWRNMHNIIRKLVTGEAASIDLESLRNLNRETAENNKTLKYALQFADAAVGEFRPALQRLFEQTLVFDPDQRGDFEEISAIFSEGQSHNQPTAPTTKVKKAVMSSPKPSDFKVSESLQTLCLGDYRLRRHILQCLSEEFNTSETAEEKSKLDFQLTFCSVIGFGTQRFPHETKFKGWPSTTGVQASQIHDEIEASRLQEEPFNEDLRRMYSTGIIQPIHGAEDYGEAMLQNQKLIKILLREEVADMEKAMGKTHAAVLRLWEGKHGDGTGEQREPNTKDPSHEGVQFWSQMAKDLETDPNYGPQSLEFLLTKAYLAMAHMGIQEFDSLDSAHDLARETHAEMMKTEQGRDHVVTVMLSRLLAQNADVRGHTEEAIKLSRQSREAVVKIFGEEHGNAYMQLDVEAALLMRQGNFEEAEALLRDAIKGLGKAIGADTMPMLNPLDQLFTTLMMAGKFQEANEVNTRCMDILLKNGFTLIDPMLTRVRMNTIDILMEQELYATAAEKCSEYISEIEKQFWILSRDQLPQLREPQPGAPPDPRAIDVMRLYSLHLIRAIAWTAQGKPDADGEILKILTNANHGLGLEPWCNLDRKTGRPGSALSTAMEEGHCTWLEILTGLGAKNLQNGDHYRKAIDIAKQHELVKPATLLEEHYAICFTKPIGETFRLRQELRQFWQGDWTGFYLYHGGGPRKDPRIGRDLRFVDLLDSEERPDTVLLRGELKDEQGEWFVQGEAQTSGSFVFWQWLKEGAASHALEYRGTVNTERAAIGGSWGPRGRTETIPQGTFFYFKST
ncbi:Protein kinase domain-containing protein [Cladophialophora immunda]|nr:Protein kinase domain-containing protein [Cladophialophora immunda]